MFFQNIFSRLRTFFGFEKRTQDRANAAIAELLGYAPVCMEYYFQALRHKSVKDSKKENNERLEYLGDAILEAVVSDIIYRMFPDKGEGFLTALRAKVVQRETLNRVAVDMGIDQLMELHALSYNHNMNVFGNAFEALLGAIYLDKGYEQALCFMKEVVFAKYLDIDSLVIMEQNFKSKLLEWGQRHRVIIDFETIYQERDDENNMIFHSSVLLNGMVVAKGVGYSKKSSHQEAARIALSRLNDKNLRSKVTRLKHSGNDPDC